MSVDELDQGEVPDRKGIAVQVLSVPKEGCVTVLFLAPIDGIMTHWRGKGSIACPGLQECPPSVHKGDAIWKGYSAAMQVHRNHETGERSWRPCVFEVTEKGLEGIGPDFSPVGCVFSFERRGTRRGKTEVYVTLMKAKHEHSFPSFPYRPVVERMYHTRAIRWGVTPDVPPPVYAETFPIK